MPTKDQICQWIIDNPALLAKRDIARAFEIKGDARIDLKRMLKELEEEGTLIIAEAICLLHALVQHGHDADVAIRQPSPLANKVQEKALTLVSNSKVV